MSSPPKHDALKRNTNQPSRGRSPPSSKGERSSPPAIAEQQPIMRSVAINPLTQHRRAIHFEPPLRKAEPGVGGPKLATTREFGWSSTPELVKSTPPKREVPPRSKSESSLARKWHVDHASLPGRPEDFPLLKTTRTVLNTPAHVISNRVSDTLQSRSIKAKFSKSEGNLVRCRNVDYCKFTVRLYSGDEGGVLVEVQRICGDAVSFMRDCRALLDASEGKSPDEQVQEEKPLYLRLPVSEMSFVKEAALPPPSEEEEAESVNVAADLLSSGMSDSNMLGMESLAIMTDPIKTSRGTAILASRRILCPKDPGNGKFSMHNYVMSLVIYQDPETEEEEEATEDIVMTSMSDHQSRLRNLAMSSLHNALSLLSTEGLLHSTVSSSEEWYSSVLVPRLLRDLEGAERSPHDACYASRCLAALSGCGGCIASKMDEGGLAEALKTAKDVGSREFEMLKTDASTSLRALQCC